MTEPTQRGSEEVVISIDVVEESDEESEVDGPTVEELVLIEVLEEVEEVRGDVDIDE